MQNKSFYFSGQGILKLAVYDKTTGQLGPYYDAGDIEKLSLSTKVETYTLKENRSGKRLKALNINHSPELDFTVELRDFSLQNLALAFYGDSATQASTAFTGKQLGDVVAGKFYQIGLMGTTVSSVTGTGGAITGYTVHNDGTISFDADHADVEVSGNTGAIDTIGLMSNTGVDVALLFDGINTFGGDAPMTCQIWKASLSPLDNMDLIGDVSAGKLTLKGSAVEAPEGSTVAAAGPMAGYGYIAFKA